MQKFELKWDKRSDPFTKELALYLCMRLWLWLACHPYKNKGDWPAWSKNGGAVNHTSSSCPCCEYDMRQNRYQEIIFGCPNCPLISLWPKGKADRVNPCTDTGSPYMDWENRIGLGCILPALRIAWAAKRELKRCLKEAAQDAQN